ncbi:hypothetical protein SY83_20505 [Paenibacillus swuensis]|uniref:HTH gntR-type domain-containing protein n=1 Tax=Paenibacillus swuensis TaxID=1178515 RepID=A0A172TNE8_9BACL|nr:PLP-dependent aminotransferase family protein [Paenibacillus swuensis]ANE48273.1 hypothetical protein SY83_20505 [Paenibacillus swuensis]
MHIPIQRGSGTAVVEQIRHSIADRIRSGLLTHGAALPSVRALAKTSGVSVMTVVQAYNQLEENGYIRRVHGKGTYVSTEQYSQEVRATPSSKEDWQLVLQDYLPRAQIWRHSHNFDPKEGELKLSMASIDRELYPLEEVSEEIYRITKSDPALISDYGPIQGDKQLRGHMADYLKSRLVSVSKEQLLITNGCQQGIDLVARTFLGPGDVVMMESPTYMAAIDVFRARGALVVPVPVDGEGMRMDVLTRLCDSYTPKLIYVNPTYQNPTGSVMSAPRRAQLLQLAQSFNALIVEDEAWSGIQFGSPPPAPIKSMDTDGHVIYMTSFSKILSPGCRIAVLAAVGTVLSRLISSKAIADLGSPLLTQQVILPFFKGNRIYKHMEKLNRELLKRRDLAIRLLREHAPAGVTWTEPMGGLNLWLTLPPQTDTDRLLHEAQRERISFLPSSAFYPGEPEYHHLRLCYSYLPPAELQMGIIQLCKLMDRHLDRQVDQTYVPVI